MRCQTLLTLLATMIATTATAETHRLLFGSAGGPDADAAAPAGSLSSDRVCASNRVLGEGSAGGITPAG